MTPAERLLWDRLRRHGLSVKFQRQAPLLHYVVDFYCASRALVVEVDGSSHKKRHIYDAGRDEAFAEFGILTLRFSNDRVISDIESVLLEIARQIEMRPAIHSALSGLAGRNYLAQQLDAGEGEWLR